MKLFFILFLTSISTIVQAKLSFLAYEKSIFKNSISERRLALVIGIKEYNRREAELTNPVNDANDMAETLKELGFEVIKRTNLSRVELEKTIEEFGVKLADYDVGLFYYSGHGIQFQNQNFLVPKDANMTLESQITYHCVNLNRVMNAMEEARTKTNILVLDACRDAPFKKSWASRSTNGGGLAYPNNPPGSITVFATSAGSTAADNPGERNGLFTSELLKFIKEPGATLSQILINAKKGVYERSSNSQMPAEYNQLLGEFRFTNKLETNPIPQKGSPVSVPKLVENIDINRSKYITVQGATFKMGLNGQSADERPAHDVKVDNFLISKFEVSISEWKAFCTAINKDMPSLPDWELPPTAPIVGISWYDAIEYCNWLSIKSNLVPCYEKNGKEVEWNRQANGYRLPTEAEWEFAARGGKNTKNTIFAGSVDPNMVGWYSENSESLPHKSGTKQANEIGLSDMSGNVWEWSWDRYSETYYRVSPRENPDGPTSGSTKVLRGGSWLSNDTRVSLRIGYMPEVTAIDCGLRVVRNQ